MRYKAAFAALCFAMFAIAPAFAGSVNFNFGFGGPDSALGASQSYTSNGATITAYGYVCSAASASSTATLSNCAATDLYAKGDGPSETGLGLVGEGGGENEIGFDGTSTDYVMGLNVTSLFKLGATSMTLTFGSVQPGEAFAVLGYGSNPFAAGTPFALTNTKAWCGYQTAGCVYNGDVVSATFGLNAQDEYLVLVSPCGASSNPNGVCGGNVLLDSLNSTAPTPEPDSLLLFGTGLLALAFAARKRFAFARK